MTGAEPKTFDDLLAEKWELETRIEREEANPTSEKYAAKRVRLKQEIYEIDNDIDDLETKRNELERELNKLEKDKPEDVPGLDELKASLVAVLKEIALLPKG